MGEIYAKVDIYLWFIFELISAFTLILPERYFDKLTKLENNSIYKNNDGKEESIKLTIVILKSYFVKFHFWIHFFKHFGEF